MTSLNKMRLQKFIAKSGYCSRRKAEILIDDGKVFLNGSVVSEQGVQVSEDDIIMIEGKILQLESEKVYYLINKPLMVLSSVMDDRGRVCVVDLVKDKYRIFPVGRLDYETTGALILTNDGEFANYLTHPRYEMPKRYRVSVSGKLKPLMIKSLSEGIIIEEVSYQGVEIFDVSYNGQLNITDFSITLHEGKNRQIRRMFDFFDLPVKVLHRYAIGPIKIDSLNHGDYRKLSIKEVNLLLNKAKGDA